MTTRSLDTPEPAGQLGLTVKNEQNTTVSGWAVTDHHGSVSRFEMSDCGCLVVQLRSLGRARDDLAHTFLLALQIRGNELLAPRHRPALYASGWVFLVGLSVGAEAGRGVVAVGEVGLAVVVDGGR